VENAPNLLEDEACSPGEHRYVLLREMLFHEQAIVKAYSRDKKNGPLVSGQSTSSMPQLLRPSESVVSLLSGLIIDIKHVSFNHRNRVDGDLSQRPPASK